MVKSKNKSKGPRSQAEKKPTEREKKPEYVIQISEPKETRKDILEALRSLIMFMQGYEKFRTIQQEKLATFRQLSKQVKELDRLINQRLTNHLPFGDLKPIKGKKMEEEMEKPELPEAEPQPALPKEMEAPEGLNRLESELQEIENRTNAAEVKASVTGEIDQDEIDYIVALKWEKRLANCADNPKQLSPTSHLNELPPPPRAWYLF